MNSILFEEEELLKHLASLKWKDGFRCRNCGHTNAISGKRLFSKRCTRCKHEESASAHTLFHNCKFPLIKAWQITSLILEGNPFSSNKQAEELGITTITCWKFKDKIETAIQRYKTLNPGEDILIDKLLFNDGRNSDFK